MPVVILVLLLILVSSVVFGEDTEIIKEDINSLSSTIRNSSPIPLTGSGGNLLRGLSLDMFNIARYLVITTLLVRVFMMLMDFSHAGDNPQLKATIKSKVIWLGIGLIVALNFWPIYTEMARIMSNIRIL